MSKHKYEIVLSDRRGSFISTSRNSKKHLQNFGGDYCEVYTMRGKFVSWAGRNLKGKIVNLSITD